MKVVLNNRFAEHQPQGEIHHGKMVPSFENPSRVDHIVTCLKAHGITQFIEPTDHGLDAILRVHPEHYVTFLKTIWQQWQAQGNEEDLVPYIWPVPGLKRIKHEDLNARAGYYAFSSDTAIMSGTWDAVYQGAQSALTAMELVINGEQAAFALTRPPGHHAHAETYGGYCFLNNAAIAAQAALDKGNQRVCILDVDYHHGNGTQDIFYSRDDILTVSIHGHPKSNFPYYLGFEDETGEDKGLGFNLNLPLEDGTSFDKWQSAFEVAAKRIGQFKPDILIVPLGVDTYEGDPISNFKLITADFATMGSMIADLNVPTVFVMEGGYDVEPIGQNVYNVLSGFDCARSTPL